ncbi:MAG: bactofilin family protein [Parvibaculales bacterium]
MASKSVPSILSIDLTVSGQIISSGDIQIDGNVEGEILSTSVTIGQTAHVRGEIAGDDIIVKGHVKGTIYGKKVHLCETAHVEGDIVHEALAIENGSYFNGSVRREKNPLQNASIQQTEPETQVPAMQDTTAAAALDDDESASVDVASAPETQNRAYDY